MKVLFVTGEDFAAVQFENAHHGVAVSDIINDPAKYEYESNSDSEDEDDEDEEGGYTLSVLEFSDVDPAFIKFIREDIQDYDHSKDTNFYLEGEVIGVSN